MEKKIKFYDTSSLLLKADDLFEDGEKFARGGEMLTLQTETDIKRI